MAQPNRSLRCLWLPLLITWVYWQAWLCWHQENLLIGMHVGSSSSWMTYWERSSLIHLRESSTNDLAVNRTIYTVEYNTDEFSLHTLDFSIRPQCGVFKCFYPSLVNKSIGYLAILPDPDYFEEMVESYVTAIEYEKKYNASHFLLDMPYLVNISQELAFQMDQNRWPTSEGPPPPSNATSNSTYSGTSKMPQFSNRAYVIIQKVRAAPTPHIFLKWSSTNKTRNDNTLKNFQKFVLNLVPNKAEFVSNFEKEMSKLWILLEHEPSYNVDFQVLLVDSRGYAHLIDFDTFGPRNLKAYIEGNQRIFGKFQKIARDAASSE